jgi:pyruvate/2-oxoglutarate dehydrogenase complex dihydrolipoamide acyltransferase (E2) component
MTQGIVRKVYFKPQQYVQCNDLVLEIATMELLNTAKEESVMEIEINEDMYVAQILTCEGATLDVGKPIALLCDNKSDILITSQLKVILF